MIIVAFSLLVVVLYYLTSLLLVTDWVAVSEVWLVDLIQCDGWLCQPANDLINITQTVQKRNTAPIYF